MWILCVASWFLLTKRAFRIQAAFLWAFASQFLWRNLTQFCKNVLHILCAVPLWRGISLINQADFIALILIVDSFGPKWNAESPAVFHYSRIHFVYCYEHPWMLKLHSAWKSKSCNIGTKHRMKCDLLLQEKSFSRFFSLCLGMEVRTCSIKHRLSADGRGLNMTSSHVLLVPWCQMFGENALEEPYKCANE